MSGHHVYSVRKGEHVAIVGVSGSGKTSCVSLLLRFYDPTRGALLIDGSDIRSYKLVDWRRTIALVLQEIYLFPGTIMQNLKAFDESILLIFILQSQVFITVFYPFVKTFQALRGLQWVI